MVRVFSFLTGQEMDASDKDILLSKCKDCGSYFLDCDKTGICCKKEERTPAKVMHSNLMQFLIERRR